MVDSCTLVFPHQLFERNPAIQVGRPVWLVEDPLFFRQYAFHLQKLVFHRASMKIYAEKLQRGGHSVHYIHQQEEAAATDAPFRKLAAAGIKEVHACDTTDYLLEQIGRAHV